MTEEHKGPFPRLVNYHYHYYNYCFRKITLIQVMVFNFGDLKTHPLRIRVRVNNSYPQPGVSKGRLPLIPEERQATWQNDYTIITSGKSRSPFKHNYVANMFVYLYPQTETVYAQSPLRQIKVSFEVTLIPFVSVEPAKYRGTPKCNVCATSLDIVTYSYSRVVQKRAYFYFLYCVFFLSRLS